MEQDIRFCELDGRRIAYATAGEGPLLLFAARWVSHLEEEWDDPQARAFFEELAQTHRVVRYDRLGAGLSDRDLPAPPTTESEMRALGTVLDACREETGDDLLVLVRRARDGAVRERCAGACGQARVLRRLRLAARRAGGHARLARRVHAAELDARRADVLGAPRPACEWRRDRRGRRAISGGLRAPRPPRRSSSSS